MKHLSPTPLSSTSLAQTQVGLLRSLWIETAEEAIAIAATLPNDGQGVDSASFSALTESALTSTISANQLALLRHPRIGGGLGCLLDADALATFRRDGRLRAAGPPPAGAFADRLPSAIRLFDRMQPVRDQSERGTCVAFAAVALREFLLANTEDLSEQFMYWACKELDGLPEAGTYLHTAMTALAQYGVCQESVWPYHPKQTNSEGQGPPPSEAQGRAEQFRLSSARTVEPGLVLHYKSVLAGKGGQGGMPVVVGTLVFGSWFNSSETHRTGKVTLPLPGEQPIGGHAWCVVGYVDDADVPGGGYFIVRNSWGPKWAMESPEAPGHALMPYEYVERCAREAFTGPTLVADKAAPPLESAEWRDFVRVLEKDERDVDGRLFSRGTPVIAHAGKPGVFRQDSPANRHEFQRLNRAWTKEAQTLAWFPPQTAWPHSFRKELERTQVSKNVFVAAIDENLTSAVKSVFPDFGKPSLQTFLPWHSRIRDVCVEVDLTEQLIAQLLDNAGLPNGLRVSDEWQHYLASINSLKVYSVRTFSVVIRVVVCFVSPLALAPSGLLSFSGPCSININTVRTLVEEKTQSRSRQKPKMTFYTIGSAVSWPEGQVGISSGDSCVFLAHHLGDRNWKRIKPNFYDNNQPGRNFIDRLRPLRWQDTVSLIKNEVDVCLEIPSSLRDDITVTKISERVDDIRKTVISAVFLTLQEKGAYKLYWADGKARKILAIAPDEERSGAEITASDLNASWFAEHASIIAGCAIMGLIAILKDVSLTFFGVYSTPSVFAISVLFLYITAMFQKKWARMYMDKD